MTNKLKTHFKKFTIAILIAGFGASAYAIDPVTFSDFTSGTTISSSEMNTKLNALKESVNSVQFAFKTDQLYTGTSSITIGAGAATELAGLDFVCPSDGFVVATYSLTTQVSFHQFGSTDSVRLQIVNIPGTVEPDLQFPGYSRRMIDHRIDTGPVHFNNNGVRRFSCTDGIPVRYRVVGRFMAGNSITTASANYLTLVLQFSPF